jgi:hypothetical protein
MTATANNTQGPTRQTGKPADRGSALAFRPSMTPPPMTVEESKRRYALLAHRLGIDPDESLYNAQIWTPEREAILAEMFAQLAQLPTFYLIKYLPVISGHAARSAAREGRSNAIGLRVHGSCAALGDGIDEGHERRRPGLPAVAVSDGAGNVRMIEDD